MRKTTSWLLAILALLVIACGIVYKTHQSEPAPADIIGTNTHEAPPNETTPSDTTKPVTKNPIVGTEWSWNKTIFITGTTNPTTGTGAAVVPTAGAFVATFGTDMSFSSTTDCNSLKGKYIVDDEVLSIGPVAATEKACTGGTLESEYTKELSRVTSYTISGNELHVNLIKDTGTMIFTKRVKAVDPAPVTPAVNLNGSTFRLISFNGIPTTADSKYLLSFHDGSISAKFCNGLGGNYTLMNSILKANTVGTLMYCESPTGLMTMESTFASMLGTGATLAQDGSTLTLTGSKGEKFVYTVFMD